MSTTIDQRVVEMQFDNRHFEQNVKTSMSTLERLKQSLRLNDAAKGFDNVSAAAKRVDMTGLSNGVETVRQRFSALEVMGVTALANITNSAVNAGKRMLSALTIDPIKTGFSEYETKINAIQTIWSNTQSKGTTMPQITETLNELNTYADKTIYNFAEMTRNIGTFTAAGIGLEESATAIKGIANLAAASGSNAQQASTAMYQLSQALASGTVKLMDWNSVVNAGMGGELFQNALKDTARAHGVAVDEMIKKAGSFRESLKDGWITSEILTETLSKMTKSGAAEYLSELTGVELEQITATQKLASEAEDSKKVYEEFAEKLAATGKVTKEEAVNILSLADNAESAATEVKTFTQLWDTLKESAQSGWAQTWEIIVGDFKEAKELLTKISDVVGGFINKMSDWRNNLLRGALDLATPWKTISTKLENSGLGKMIKGVEEVSEKVAKAGKKLEDFQDIVNKVWRGDYKNSDTGRFEKLDSEGWDHRVVQDLVNKGYGYKITMEDVEASHKKFGLTMDESTKAMKGTADAIGELTDKQLKKAGLTEEEIKLYRDLEKEAKKTGKSVGELAKAMSEKDGRTLLIESFSNAGQGLVSVLKAIGQAWIEIFPPMSVVQLYGIISSINEFSQHLKVGDETADKLKRTLKGVFAIVDILATIFGGGLRIAFKVLQSILKYFNLDLLDFTAMIGDALVKVRDWFDGLFDVSGILDVLVPWIVDCAKAIKDWVKSLKDTKLFKTVSKYLGDMTANIKEWFKSFDAATAFKNFIKLLQNGVSAIKDWFKALYESDSIAGDIIRGLVNGLRDGATTVWNAAVNMAKNIVEAVKNFLGIHSPSTVFIAIGGFIIAGLLAGLTAGRVDIVAGMKKICSLIVNGIKNIFNSPIWGKIGDLFKSLFSSDGPKSGGLADKLSEWFGKIKDVFANIIDWFKTNIGDFNGLLSTIYRIILAFGTLWMFKQIGDLIGGLGRFLDNLGDVAQSLKKVGNSLALALKAEAMKSFATSILILAGAIAILALIAALNPWALVGAVVAITVIMGLLIGMTVAMGTVDPKRSITPFMLMILGLAGAMVAIAILAKTLAPIAPEDLAKAGIAIAVLVGLVAGLTALGSIFASSYKQLAAVSAFGNLMLKIAASIGLLAIALKIISDIPGDKLGMATAALAALGYMFGALIILTGIADYLSKGSMEKFGATMLGIGGAFILLALTMKILGSLSEQEIVQASLILIVLSGIIGSLILLIGISAGISGGSISQFGSTMLGIGGAFALLALTMHILAALDPNEFERSLSAIWSLTGVIAVLMVVTKLCSPREAVKMSGTIFAVAGAIAILAAIALLLSFIDNRSLKKGLMAVTALAGLIAILVYATKNAQNCTGTLWALVGAIAVLAAAIGILSLCDPKRVVVATGAIGALILAFSVLVSKTKNVSGSIGTLVTLSLSVALMGGILYAMSKLKVKNALPNAIALSTLLLAMSGVLAILKKIGTGSIWPAYKAMIALTALVAPLAAFGGAIRGIQAMGINESVITPLKILGAVIGAMALLLVPLAVLGKTTSWHSLIGVLALTSMVAPLAAFAGVIRGIQAMGIESSVERTILMLVGVMAAMTLLLIPLSLIGLLWGAMSGLPLVGVAALIAMVLPLLAFAKAIEWIGNMDVSKGIPFIKDLLELMGAMTDMLVKVSLVAPLALTAVAAIAALEAVLVSFGVIATAVGALVSKFPQIESFIDTGIPIMEKLAEGVGSILGKFVYGFGYEVIQLIPAMGQALSDFLENADYFLENIGKVKESTLTKVGYLAGAIALLTAAEFLDNLTSFMGFGEGFVGLGDKLTDFIEDVIPAFEALDEAGISTETISSVKTLAEALLMITGAELLDQISNLVFSKSNEESFSVGMVSLANGIKSFGAASKDIDTGELQNGIDALMMLVEASKAVPNQDWYVKLIPWGRNDEAVFGDGLAQLGAGIKGFATECEKINADSVAGGIAALKALIDASAGVPNADWYVKLCPWGRDDNAVFGDGLAQLGAGIKGFATECEKINADSVAGGCAALLALIEASKGVPNADWYVKICPWAKGDEAVFGDGLAALGKGIGAFSTNCGDINATKFEAAVAGVVTLANAAKNIPDAQWYTKLGIGKSDEQVFAQSLKALGTGIAAFYKAVNDTKFNAEKMNSMSTALNSVIKFTKSGSVSKETSEKWKTALTNLGSGLYSFYTKANQIISEDLVTGADTVFAAVKKVTDMVKSSDISGTHANLELLTNALDNLISLDASSSTIAESIASIAEINLQKVSDACASIADDMGGLAEEMLSSFATGIGDNVSTATDACAAMVEDCVTAAKGVDFSSAGKAVVTGFAAGITDNTYLATARAKAMAQAAERAAKNELDINSPSKVFRAIGTSVPEGFAQGIDKLGGLVKNSARSMAQTSINSVKSTISNLASMVSSDIDSQPTIRPVLDLSDVRTGIGAIDGMLNQGSMLGVTANVGAINTMMNRRIQNGASTSDVVSAIDKLNKHLDNVGNTSYTINGVTYDDGTNIANTVRDLVRYARIERRV